MKRGFGMLFLIAVSSPGCGVNGQPDWSSSGSSVGQRSQAIIGGVSDANDPAVVLLIASSNQGESLCTAEVISPHVVLTAAHCVDPASVGNGNTFQIFLGNDYNSAVQANNKANYVAVASTHFNAKFNLNNLQGGNDTGIVITKSAINVSPLPINRTPLTQNDVGSTVRLIGYGITSGRDTQGTSAGTKRQVATTIGQLDNLFIEFDDPAHMTCEGDSGGPALLMQNGVEVIAGITSFGDQGCTQYGDDTNVASYLSWIDPYVQQYDPQQGMNPNPDMATPAQSPDMAVKQNPQNPDMSHAVTVVHDMASNAGSGNGKGTQQLGQSCQQHSDCFSGTCAFTTNTSGYCTARCDPNNAACPNGLVCGEIDGVAYCVFPAVPTGNSSGGCTLGGAAPAGSGGLLGLLLAVPALVARRRRARITR